MAKNDREKVNKAIQTERDTTNQQYGGFIDTAKQNLATETARANQQGDILTSGYQDIYSRGGIDPAVAANLRALNRNNSSVYGPSVGGSDSGGSHIEGGGGGGGGSVGGSAPTDAFGTSRAAFQNFINSGGVDINAMKEALGGYRTLAESGGFSPEDKTSIKDSAGRLAEIGKTGGYDPARLASINQNIGNLSEIGKTGGFSPEVLGLIRGDISGLRDIGQTGGVSASDINRARGGGVFDEFAQTGGYSPSDIQNYRARALSPISSQYANDLAEIQRSNSLLGSASPNYGASIARLNRNRGLGLADATRNAETDLQAQIREGRLSGAREMSGAELKLQDLITGNKLRGLESAATGEGNLADAVAGNRIAASSAASTQEQNLQNAINDARLRGDTASADTLTNLANSIAQNQLTALGGITNTQQGAEEIAQRGKIAGAQGMFGVESADQQAALAREAQAAASSAAAAQTGAYSDAQRAADEQYWARFNQNNEQYIGSLGLEGQLGALGGLNQARGTTPGGVALNYDAILGAMGGRNQGVNQGLQLQQQNVGPGVLDNIMKFAGIAGAAAAPFTGGMTGGIGRLPPTDIPGGTTRGLPQGIFRGY